MTFRFAKLVVNIDFWFAAIITLMLVLVPESNAAVCFAMCLLHEAGHLLAMTACGKKTEKIQLGYFGIKIVTEKRLLSPVKEALIAFSGPFVNLLLFFVFYILDRNDYAVINLGLSLFNLLPVTALDGGHIISAFFPDSKIHRKSSIICSVILLVTGIIIAVHTRENFTIIIVAFYLIIGTLSEEKGRF